MKLGMLVVLGTSVIQVVFRLQNLILNSSFAYFFWLANNNKGIYLGVWVVLRYYPCVLLLSMHMSSFSLAYFFWLANNNKVKYPAFHMGYSDKTSSVWLQYSTQVLPMCSFVVLIPHLHISPKVTHAIYAVIHTLLVHCAHAAANLNARY